MEGGALINMDFGESEIWGAFIFEDFHTMEGGALIYLRFENLKFGVRLFLKICTQ